MTHEPHTPTDAARAHVPFRGVAWGLVAILFLFELVTAILQGCSR